MSVDELFELWASDVDSVPYPEMPVLEAAIEAVGR